MKKTATTVDQSEFAPRLVIRASAGTGKTFQLTSRYIALLRNVPPERILASTFTRKAAGEILERVLVRLAKTVADEHALRELRDEVGPPALGRDECLRMLADLTRNLHRVSICTLDSFFARLAGSYALELGLPPGWRILDESETAGLRGHAIETVLREGVPHETVQLMHLLDKGRSARSVSGLISTTVEDMYDVFLASPAEAWNQFPQGMLLSAERRGQFTAAIESVPLTGKMAKARDDDCVAARAEDWETFLSKGLTKKIVSGDPTYYRSRIPEDLHEPYRLLAEHGRSLLMAAWQHQTVASHTLLGHFHQAYENLKRAAGGLEFGDVTRRLSQSETPQHGFRLDLAIEHLLLDEFQDTSAQQWHVVRPLAEQVCRTKSQSFFCVGDVKQAIYGWRGGEAAIFDALEQQLQGLETRPLNVSYRSAQPVIDVVNRVMTGLNRHDNLLDHAELLNHWCHAFPTHSTSRTELAGYVCLRSAPAPRGADDGETTAEDRIEKLCEFTAATVRDLAASSPQSTIGILTRRNSTVGRLIFELNRLGVEASEEGGNPLTDSAAVQLVLSLMTLADHPGHTIARYHVARSPLGRTQGYLDHHDDAKTDAFSAKIRAQLLDQGYGGFVQHLVTQLRDSCNRRELRRLMQLAILAEEFDALFTTLRPGEFVDYVGRQRREEPTNARVRVMNVHQAKGLEFDIVVLPELDQSLIRPPRYVAHIHAPGSPPDLVALYRDEATFEQAGGPLLAARQQTLGRVMQESLCLLYVAMTRAIHSLHLILLPETKANFPKTYAGLIRAALIPDQALDPETILFEHGDPRWFEKTANVEAGGSAQTTPTEPQRLRLQFAPSPTPRHLERQTPSAHKGARLVSLEEVLGLESAAARARGTAIHRWLEEIDWLEESVPVEEQLRPYRRIPVPQEEDIEESWRELVGSLQRPAIRRLFLRESYADRAASYAQGNGPLLLDVRQELSFAHVVKGKMMVGSVDRLVLMTQNGQPLAADVLDFKTDVLPNADAAQERVERYGGQMRAYRDAVSRLFGLSPDRITVRLVFLSIGQVELLTFSDVESGSEKVSKQKINVSHG